MKKKQQKNFHCDWCYYQFTVWYIFKFNLLAMGFKNIKNSSVKVTQLIKLDYLT